MQLELLIHPAIAAAAVLAVVLAYIVKTTKKLYYRLHYVAGTLAFALSMTAFPLGLYFVLTNGGYNQFPEALIFHTLNFFVAIGLIVIQSGLGMGMLLFGRKRNVYVTHREPISKLLF
jgi:hypothetical protein